MSRTIIPNEKEMLLKYIKTKFKPDFEKFLFENTWCIYCHRPSNTHEIHIQQGFGKALNTQTLGEWLLKKSEQKLLSFQEKKIYFSLAYTLLKDYTKTNPSKTQLEETSKTEEEELRHLGYVKISKLTFKEINKIDLINVKGKK